MVVSVTYSTGGAEKTYVLPVPTSPFDGGNLTVDVVPDDGQPLRRTVTLQAATDTDLVGVLPMLAAAAGQLPGTTSLAVDAGTARLSVIDADTLALGADAIGAYDVVAGVARDLDQLDTAALNALEVRTRARRLWRQFGGKLGLVVVDYLQLMSSSNPKAGENRATELSEISRSMKALAKELNVPVIALSQLSRAVESRNDKRPMMSDLRESGAIEQDADVILFIYRDEVYKKDETPEDKKGVAEVIIGKQRNGPIGTVELSFLGRYTRFENLTRRGNEY